MAWFVTGTDTGVGKTVVTACLARAARGWGSVVACKPVASGVEDGTAGEDAEHIAAAAGHPPSCFATFRAPLSPHRAAELEGGSVPADLLDRIRGLEADTVLVEGVGGWMVPIRTAPPLWVADLARAAGGGVVVVAADRLGVINHTLLTLAAVRASGLVPVVVVLNRGPADDPDPSRSSNLDDLRRLADVPVVGIDALPPGDDGAQERVGRELWRAILPQLPPR